MAEEGTELERRPLQALQQLEEGTRGTCMQSTALEDDVGSRPSTSGRTVPTINWGEKLMSPVDLEVAVADLLNDKVLAPDSVGKLLIIPLALCRR